MSAMLPSPLASACRSNFYAFTTFQMFRLYLGLSTVLQKHLLTRRHSCHTSVVGQCDLTAA
jgi:hypothetical protein